MNLSEISELANDETKAVAFVERMRWPNGPICPHCENADAKRIGVLGGRSTRVGLRKCYVCRKQFTVRVGSIFEDSHLPLGKWLLAIHLMCASKKGVSAKQIERQLGITYKAAWFLCHRIRLAMTKPPLWGKIGGGGYVEADETYIGGKAENNKHKNFTPKKKPVVLTLIERGGEVRSFPLPDSKRSTIQSMMRAHIHDTAYIFTDSAKAYPGVEKNFVGHSSVNHSKEYVRGIIHTNFAESYHSLIKRGIVGVFHHVSEEHLHRYLREFEFRWNSRKATDGARFVEAVRGAEGKRLTYRPLTTR